MTTEGRPTPDGRTVSVERLTPVERPTPAERTAGADAEAADVDVPAVPTARPTMAPDPAYCPTCGTALDRARVEGRERAVCPACERPVYRNPKPCAGVLVVAADRLLLVQRTAPPAVGDWSLPAGYLEVDEPPAEAAVRELAEETGLRAAVADVELFDTTFVTHPDGTTVLVVVYTAPASATSGRVDPGSDAADAQFWDLATLRDRGEAIEPGYADLFERAVETDGS